MTWEIAVAVLGVITGIGGFIFGLVSAIRNKKSDDTSEGKQTGIVLTELGYIKSGVDRMERKQDEQDKKYTELAVKQAESEASTKQAHKRIDGLTQRVEKLEEHEHHE